MAYLIYTVFFLSGVAALIFETIWFRLAGLIFGNSVWGAALILAGFMGGLALGNGLVARFGDRVNRPVYFYAGLEFLIAVTGMSLVLLLPVLENLLAPVFRLFLEYPWAINPLRLSIAFMLVIIPTTAMGATLPILVKALYRNNKNFGLLLGRLYGLNTLGAVLGALLGEMFLIKWVGIRGAGLSAALFNLVAAFVAVRIGTFTDRDYLKSGPENHGASEKTPLSLTGRRLVFAAFLSGGILLSLEVVWFRFLLLSHSATSLVFSVMLSIVLLGIGIGGLIASWWYKFRVDAHVHLRSLSAFSGILTVITYAGFHWVFTIVKGLTDPSLSIFLLFASSLMIPVSIVSGILFTMLGRAIKEEIKSETRSAGILTLANTLGAMLGPFFAGFFLLPHLGMEDSFFILSAGYGIIALIIPQSGKKSIRRNRVFSYGVMAGFMIIMLLFPFGRMDNVYFGIVSEKLRGAKREAVREGLTETIFYYRYDIMGEPFYYRLITNGFSMSSTSIAAKRYMKLFVYLPVALHPDMRHALLISYGVGSTAKALTDTKSLDTIDIVDISKDILEMSSIVYPDASQNPLYDERVSVHIEDGRFFLRTTRDRFDLITSEPPPPKHMGIVNLYTQEYFKLIHDRLSEGGIVSYWLPIHSLYEEDAQSIVKAFCNVFDDCSLWSGSGLDWILLGTRNAYSVGSVSLFSRQWQDHIVGKELRELGFEIPAQLGSLFIADASDLKSLTKNSLPLTDNFPLRLSTAIQFVENLPPLFRPIVKEDDARKRFQNSEFIKGAWPEKLIKESLKYFRYQKMINSMLIPAYQRMEHYIWDDLYQVLTQTSLRTLPLWLMGTTHRELEIAIMKIYEDPHREEIQSLLAMQAIAERNYHKAVRHLEAYLVTLSEADSTRVYPLYLFVLCMAEENEKAEEAARKVARSFSKNEEIVRYWKWMQETFDFKPPL